MNKNKLLNFEIFSTIFTFILGTILHFTYNWSNNNILIGTFSAVNESIWEHLKLLFFPMLITTIIGYFYFNNNISNYLCIRVKSIIISLIFIIIFFYTYTGILGKNIAFIDIGSFFIAVIIGNSYTIKKSNNTSSCHNILALTILTLLTLEFILFTFFTPHIGLFKDPITGLYGI